MGRSVRISPDDEEHGLRPDFLLEDHQSLHTNAHGKLPHKGEQSRHMQYIQTENETEPHYYLSLALLVLHLQHLLFTTNNEH